VKKPLLIITFLIFTIQILSQSQLKMTSANINFRSDPWIGENVICVIPKASMLSVDFNNQNVNDWVKINYNNKVGYVYSAYLINPQIRSAFSSTKEFNNSNSSIKYYINSKGEKVQSPTYYSNPPAGATAECRDGTYSFSQSRRGTCSSHGGVKRWL
jgi:uncharacterized protein YraI